MKSLLLTIFFCLGAHAATYTATTCSAADVQTAINLTSNGDTVIIPQGACTWTTQVNANTGITITGQTSCVPSGTPGTSGYTIPCADNSHTCSVVGTCITLTIDQNFQLTPPISTVGYVSGITWLIDVVSGHGAISLSGTHNTAAPAFRFHHNHIVGLNTVSADSIDVNVGIVYGLLDHNFWEDLNTSLASIPVVIEGDWPSNGYWNWEQGNGIGSNQAVYVESNVYTALALNNEDFGDCYAGAQIVDRFNTIINSWGINCHGTDSGGFRSAVFVETYENYLSMASSIDSTLQITNSRGGVYYIWENTFGGTATPTASSLNYLRYQGSSVIGGWGVAAVGLNWTPATLASSNMVLNPQAVAYQTSHTYAAHSYVLGGGFNFLTVAGGTTGGSAPSWPSSPFATVTDSGGVLWENAAGGTGAPPGTGGTNAGFLSTDNETPCTSGATCTRPLDPIGGVYPYRDQPGVGHGQIVMPLYAWNNVNGPASDWSDATGGLLAVNRDYYNYNASFTGATGVGSGVLASRPGTCTTGVAYWATDQGTWNQSSSGGQGLLYTCVSTNTWSLGYTPYTYPHPLAGSGSVTPTYIIIGKNHAPNPAFHRVF